MTRLNQILAIRTEVLADAEKTRTAVHHDLQKDGLLSGLSRTYQPKFESNDDEEDDRQPSEQKLVQLTVPGALEQARGPWERLLTVTYERDHANTMARADVVVDGETILKDAPATYLLWLEKELTHLHTLISKLPRLDPSKLWRWSEQAGFYESDPVETTATKKVPKSHILVEPTKEHPAQAVSYTEDIVVGYWTRKDFSGAIPADKANKLLARVRELQHAVKQAREHANMTEITHNGNVGNKILGYVLDEVTE